MGPSQNTLSHLKAPILNHWAYFIVTNKFLSTFFEVFDTGDQGKNLGAVENIAHYQRQFK